MKLQLNIFLYLKLIIIIDIFNFKFLIKNMNIRNQLYTLQKVKIFNCYIIFIVVFFFTISCANHHSFPSKTNLTKAETIQDSTFRPLYRNLKNINEGKNLIFHFNLSTHKPLNDSIKENNAKKNTITRHSISANFKQLAEKN